jgi:hypothetical protein
MLSLHTILDGGNSLTDSFGTNVISSLVIGFANVTSATTPGCGDAFVSTVTTGIGNVIHILVGIGIAIAVIGIVVGGLMRATAWGSDQRIAMSNKAITCAVVGLVIVLIGVTLGNSIPQWFAPAGGATSCTIAS